MIAARLQLAAVCALVLAGVATPLAVRQHARSELRGVEAALRQGADRLDELSAENERLSKRVASPSQSFSQAQLDELVRLRHETAQLRAKAEAAEQLRAENHEIRVRLEERARGPLLTASEYHDRLSSETIEALQQVLRELPGVLEQFTRDHPGKLPRYFSELRPYFRESGTLDAGLYSFEFVADEGLEDGESALLLREVGLRQALDGRWARVYAFGDGRVVEQVLPGDVSFDSWEEQYANQNVP